MLPSKNMYEFDALGTHWWCELLAGRVFTDELCGAINAIVRQFMDDYSRFDEKSLVSRLNTTGKIDNPPGEMVKMMDFAKKMYYKTDGVFNISAGGVLSVLGYGNKKHSAKLSINFWDDSVVSRKVISIPRSVTVDFGGFGKGWLIDKLSKLLTEKGFAEHIINGGGDIFVSSSELVELGLEHPYDSSKIIGSTRIKRGALAVSSVVKRKWENNGRIYHHLIDPVIEGPSDGPVISSYVRADTALIADTLSKCFIIRPELKDKLSHEFSLRIILVNKEQLSEIK